MYNTKTTQMVAATAQTLTYDGVISTIYHGPLDKTLAYAAGYFDRDTGDAYEGYYHADKFVCVRVYDEDTNVIACFEPIKTTR